MKEMEGLGNTLAPDLLPDPAGSVLYDSGVQTAETYNHVLKTRKVSIRQTSFEEFLKGALPGHIASLRSGAEAVPEAFGHVAPRANDGEGLLLSILPPPSDRILEAEEAILDDVFMGFYREWA